mmetsp:Transcript_96142/g.256988  ORF Transcript_96142/g.256988 Transcript_96142/m.256988 type:complete len:370 (-) Transcript_96142:160-1269(-)
MSNGTKTEDLPPGVGRVPLWWMEITPHYVLDRAEDLARKETEAQMSVLFEHLAAMEDAGYLDENGRPKLGPDGKPLGWGNNGWAGRQGGTDVGTGGQSGSGGGRNFKSGGAFLDPKLFGIPESHPDYQAYLTGAKLPPGYLEMLEKYKKGELNSDFANNLKQTNFGNYGRQAETPEFKPAWARMKLRSTNQGSMIRKGQYDDSPSKVVNRLRSVEAADVAEPPLREDSTLVSVQPDSPNLSQSQTIAPEVCFEQQSTMTSDIRTLVQENTESIQESTPESSKSSTQQYSHGDYYNAKPNNAGIVAPASEEIPDKDFEEIYEEVSDEEDDCNDEGYDKPDQGSSGLGNLTDLQAILAEKQAELRRLQGLL